MSDTRKIQFGCGENYLEGWENYDIEMDISKLIPKQSDYYDFIFAEHVVEHVDSPTALKFFYECKRILKPGGVLRVAVPSVNQVRDRITEDYLAWTKELDYGDGTVSKALTNIILNHGRLSSWNYDLLDVMLEAAEFDIRVPAEVGKSTHPELSNIEGHGKVIGDVNNLIETIVIEATKSN